MQPFENNPALQQLFQITPLSELPEAVVRALPHVELEGDWAKPTPILIIPKERRSVSIQKWAGNYFAGGLPALMQAVRMLKENPTAQVTYVNDGKLRKSTQSAHQGHVHPTEWATSDCDTKVLIKLLLNSFHLLQLAPPEDVENYLYVHFPLSKIRPLLFLRFFGYRILHTLLSKNGASADDRWQCDAVRASLDLHRHLSDEIVAAGGKPTFTNSWRLIWSPDGEGLERKRALWSELGIQADFMSREELIEHSLIKEDAQVKALKIQGDGKFFAETDRRIVDFLEQKYSSNFQGRTVEVAELYIDPETKEPFAVLERSGDGVSTGVSQIVGIDSFFGSTGHNQVFKVNPATQKKKALWYEVPVSGVSTLWVCSVAKQELETRFHTGVLSDQDLKGRLMQFVGTANLTNFHMTIWDVVVDGDTVHILARATEGANFNSEVADPDDLHNMMANIDRFFIGNWRLISAGTCIRKTTVSNIPEFTENFLHGLSGIGLSFSGAPKEMFSHKPLSKNPFSAFK